MSVVVGLATMCVVFVAVIATGMFAFLLLARFLEDGKAQVGAMAGMAGFYLGNASAIAGLDGDTWMRVGAWIGMVFGLVWLGWHWFGRSEAHG